MSGLGFLQATLSLCYFNQMPKSFVKQIFNVEFLDKLDIELASCYYKVSTLCPIGIHLILGLVYNRFK